MIEPQTVKLLLDCIATIEQSLQTKKRFLASLCLQDKVLSGLHELSEISRSISWGYRGTQIERAWYRINRLVFQQLLIPGARGVDLYRVWKVTSEGLPIIKREVNLWANLSCGYGNGRIIK